MWTISEKEKKKFFIISTLEDFPETETEVIKLFFGAINALK
jgi:hypothetical protein